jgi:hypothetical protein
MKYQIRFLTFSFLLIGFSNFFVSCSGENSLTSPPSEKNQKSNTNIMSLCKNLTSDDTLITLPQSGKALLVKKDADTNRLKQLDAYIATHVISYKKPTTANPNALSI